MLRKITKIVFAFAGAMLALGLVIVLSLSVWVMTGPKSLTKLLPYIESSLNPPKSPYDVSIDDAVIYWDGWSKPLDFRLRGVSLKSIQAQNELIKLNEISVGLDLASLLRFNVVPKTIILRNPQMRFFRDDDGEFYIGIGSATNQRIPLTYLLASADGGEDASKEDNALIGNIQLIAIEHAQLLLGAPDAPALFDAQDVNLHISRDNKAINAQLNIAMHYGEKPSQISGNLRLTNTQDMVVAKMELLDISPHMFARLVPEVPELATLNMPLSGWADVAVDNAGNVTVVDYKLQSTGGVFTQENYFAEPLTITHGMFEGQIRDNFQQFVVNQALVKFGESSLRVNGLLQKYPQGWAYDAIAVAEKMPINDLYKYWPHSIANTSYDWVTTHIRDGMVSKAEAHAKLTQEQIGEPFPESALDVTILAQNATVEYLPEHPKVKNVDATVEFNGKGMSITANKGKMLDAAVLKKALLSIDDLKSHKPRMHIELDVEAPAKDVATYLAIPPLDFAAPLGLDAATIAGSAAANMRFDFTLKTRFNDNYNPDLDFAINALVSGGVQPDFMGDMNLSAANGTLNITQDMLDYAGTMAISNAPLNIELRHYFKPEDFQSKYRTKYHAKGVMAVPQLAAFGVPELPFMAGNVGLDVYIQRNPTSSKINGEADITQVAANIPEIGLSKQNGTKGRIAFEGEIGGGTLALSSFILEGDEIYASGSALVRDELSTVENLRFDRLEYGDNNLAMVLQNIDGGYRIRAKGPSLDLKPLFDEAQESDISNEAVDLAAEAEKPLIPFNLDFHGEFDWVVIGKERELRKVNAQLQCSPELCESVDTRGVTGQSNEFIYQIKRIDGIRELNFTAQNAGSFLKAMDLYDNMVGGAITVRGRFNDNSADKPFNGKVDVTKHTISNAPILAKIASLLSVSGIGDALSGNGITFQHIVAQINYAKGVAKIKDGKAYGPALGITVEDGWVDTNAKQLYLNGTFVPSYTLNTALDNIPVIGEVLTGGKGEGVFAANYKVSGEYPDNAEVTVNPLTMLAPGFLRNIFGGKSNKVVPPSAEKKSAVPAAAIDNKQN